VPGRKKSKTSRIGARHVVGALSLFWHVRRRRCDVGRHVHSAAMSPAGGRAARSAEWTAFGLATGTHPRCNRRRWHKRANEWLLATRPAKLAIADRPATYFLPRGNIKNRPLCTATPTETTFFGNRSLPTGSGTWHGFGQLWIRSLSTAIPTAISIFHNLSRWTSGTFHGGPGSRAWCRAFATKLGIAHEWGTAPRFDALNHLGCWCDDSQCRSYSTCDQRWRSGRFPDGWVGVERHHASRAADLSCATLGIKASLHDTKIGATTAPAPTVATGTPAAFLIAGLALSAIMQVGLQTSAVPFFG